MNTFQTIFFWIGIGATGGSILLTGIAIWLKNSPEEREEQEKHEWMKKRYPSSQEDF